MCLVGCLNRYRMTGVEAWRILYDGSEVRVASCVLAILDVDMVTETRLAQNNVVLGPLLVIFASNQIIKGKG